MWSNWAGNQTCRPAAVEAPRSVDELADAVKRAAHFERTVKVVGSGHSFTDIAATSGTQLVMGNLNRVIAVDRESMRVTVEAGITIRELGDELSKLGLALPNLGDIGYQTISGAVSTGTHGTGRTFNGIASQIVGFELVTADGSVVSVHSDSTGDDGETFSCGRVGLGALGALATVTLQCVPAFNLHAVEEPLRIDAVLDDLDGHLAQNEHFEFYWVPHTRWALTKANNRTDRPAGEGGLKVKAKDFYDKVLLENVAFGAVCRVGRRKPEWIPRLARMIPSSGRLEYVKRSDQVFTTPRYVRFYEMEYAVPIEHAAAAVNGVRQLVERERLLLSFPVEVRFLAPDDIPLSMASGRPSCFVAVHVYKGMGYEQYFRGVEAIMNELGGRPHWGKLHYQTAAVLSGRYPEWDRFQAARNRLDPDRLFRNVYTDRVLG